MFPVTPLQDGNSSITTEKRLKRVLVSAVSAVSAGCTADEILTEFAGRVEQLFDSSFRSFRLQVVLGLFVWWWWG